MISLKLNDGRMLSYNIFGDQNGIPVIFSHGFTDSHVIRHPDDRILEEHGIRWIAADEPGVGYSSPNHGRKMIDWGNDMEELANHLTLDTFHVAGHSGGGPHALAIAHHLPDRVTSIALAAPAAPFSDPATYKMLKLSAHRFLAKTHHFSFICKFLMKLASNKVQKDPEKFLVEAAKTAPNEGKTLLYNEAYIEMFAENFRIGFMNKGEGAVEMFQALWDWGFDIKNVTQPTIIFNCMADDIFYPEMGYYLRDKLPNSSLYSWENASHYAFVEKEHWIEFINAAIGKQPEK